jgi:imidazolonepropionase-like amidohydrolase
MTAWGLRGTELPFGTDTRSWWIDDSGRVCDDPLPGAESLPGRYILPGLVDAHAHPAIGAGPTGPMPLEDSEALINLSAWAKSGVTVLRDVGSPGGRTLDLVLEQGMPRLQAAGRFLAPSGRYFPQLLIEAVDEGSLVAAGLAEVSRGATWVKVIADFPDLTTGSDAEPTYSVERIAQLTAAVHEHGARVAVHSTVSNAGLLVAAGVDSIEHGLGLDEAAIADMARRGTAWTPTLCAMFALLDDPKVPPVRRRAVEEASKRLAELIPLAVRLGVPVLTGTDVTGSVAREVARLSDMGLDPSDALAAGSVWPRRFLGVSTTAPDIVTYHHDPREDPAELNDPAAVVVDGIRIR